LIENEDTVPRKKKWPDNLLFHQIRAKERPFLVSKTLFLPESKGIIMHEIEIYSDFNCIWCYFDKPSIKKLEREYEVQIRYRAFPLHPDIPEHGMPIEELFGHNFPLMTDKMHQLEKIATSLGLPLAKRSTISDTRLSQEVAKWAETKGKLKEYQDAIYKAYFSDGLNIADKNILADITQACGLSKEKTLKIIETRAFSEAVDRDWDKSEELGIMVAPTYIMNGTKLMGSQTYEKLEALMVTNNVLKKTKA
jgi:predicted DsbA family dithiol-disulfide isomerase